MKSPIKYLSIFAASLMPFFAGAQTSKTAEKLVVSQTTNSIPLTTISKSSVSVDNVLNPELHVKNDAWKKMSAAEIKTSAGASITSTEQIYKVDNPKYHSMADIAFIFDGNHTNKPAGFIFNRYPEIERQDVNDVLHFGVEKTTIEHPEEAKRVISFLIDQLKTNPSATVEIEGHASFTGIKDFKQKEAHNDTLSIRRGNAAFNLIKKECLKAGISEAEFNSKVQLKKQAFGDRKPLENTELESDANRVAIISIKGAKIEKNLYQRLTVNQGNAEQMHFYTHESSRDFAVYWNAPVSKDNPHPDTVESAREIRFENLSLYGKDGGLKGTPTMDIHVNDAKNLKLVINTDDLNPTDKVEIASSGSEYTIRLTRGTETKDVMILRALTYHGERNNLGDISKQVYFEKGGREDKPAIQYQNYNGNDLATIMRWNESKSANDIAVQNDKKIIPIQPTQDVAKNTAIATSNKTAAIASIDAENKLEVSGLEQKAANKLIKTLKPDVYDKILIGEKLRALKKNPELINLIKKENFAGVHYNQAKEIDQIDVVAVLDSIEKSFAPLATPSTNPVDIKATIAKR